MAAPSNHRFRFLSLSPSLTFIDDLISWIMKVMKPLTELLRSHGAVASYVLAGALPVSAFLARRELAYVLGNEAPLLTFFLAISLTAIFGGIIPGVVATLISGALGVYFFIEPLHSFAIERQSDIARLLIFLFEGFVTSVAVGVLRSARSNALARKAEMEMTQRCADLVSWSWDVKQGEVSWGGAFEKVYGLSHFTTDNWLEGVPKEDADRVAEAFHRALEERTDFSETFRYRMKDGQTRWINSKGGIIFDKRGAPVTALGINVDVTEQRRLLEDLRNAKEAAEAANHAKSAFLANMSHEIRTPLGAVLGFSELLISERLTASERANYTEAIKRNGALLSAVINDILDLSKVEAGKLEIERNPVLLSEVLTDITTMLNFQAQEKGLRLSVETDGLVPNFIETDVLRLRQILLNIVGNAIKFTKRGAVEVKIKLLAEHGPRCLVFAVTDSGPGLTQQQAGKLFEPFSQADASTKRNFGGTGLGLVLAKRLAKALGGDVVLTESTYGKGSTFTISIDPGNVDELALGDAVVRAQPITDAENNAKPLDGVKVLLAEDAPDNQVLIERILKIAGARVDIAENGKDAVNKAHNSQYDVLLMDLQMPIMDGYEATAELRKEGYQVPIIALTAHAQKEERQRCLAGGFSDHLCKPVDRKALIASVAHYSGRSPGGGNQRFAYPGTRARQAK